METEKSVSKGLKQLLAITAWSLLPQQRMLEGCWGWGKGHCRREATMCLQLFPSGDFSGTSLSRVVRSVFKQDSVGEGVASLFLSMKYT